VSADLGASALSGMTPALVVPLLVSLKVAVAATALILPPGILLGWLMARREMRGKSVLETVAALPLILPPTAVGYLLLRLLARDGLLGERALGFDLGLLLTWKGAAVAAAVMALPLVARTARVAFERVDPRLEALARTLGLGPARTFFWVTVPLARPGLLAAAILGFGRVLGEFGATVIVAGNIPGRTQTLALAIFNDIQVGRDREALVLVGIAVVLAFAATWTVEALLRRERRAR
jgi:molybdate transport system permease protein